MTRPGSSPRPLLPINTLSIDYNGFLWGSMWRGNTIQMKMAITVRWLGNDDLLQAYNICIKIALSIWRYSLKAIEVCNIFKCSCVPFSPIDSVNRPAPQHCIHYCPKLSESCPKISSITPWKLCTYVRGYLEHLQQFDKPIYKAPTERKNWF